MSSPVILRRAATATVSTLALLLAVPSAALAGGTTAQVDVQHDCTSVDVTSSKDISNVVLAFADGDRQKHDGLSGHSGTFSGTGANAGELITTAWVKSGNNKSGDGPGYGARFDFSTSGCDSSGDDGYPTGGSAQPTDEEPEATNEPDDAPSEDTRPKAASTASIQVQGSCDAVRVTSSKDISNIVLAHTDGTHQKFDGLSGRSGTFEATGGRTITTVWVKSGANHSGDGPGYGERFDLATDHCGSDGTTGDDDPTDRNPADDDGYPTGGDPSDDEPVNDTPDGEGDDDAPTDDGSDDDASDDDAGDDKTGRNPTGDDTTGEDTTGDDPAGQGAGDELGDALGTDQSRDDDATTGTSEPTDDATATPADEDPEVLGVVLERAPTPAVDADTDVSTASGSDIDASRLPNTGVTGLPAALAAALVALLIGAGLVRRSRIA